jgi:hypothetical protein
MLKLKPKYGLCCIFKRFSAKKEYQKKVDSFIERSQLLEMMELFFSDLFQIIVTKVK